MARETSKGAFAGKRVAFYGNFRVWPGYHAASPADVAQRLGATVVEELNEKTDIVVFGEGKGPGRAEAKKKVEKMLATLKKSKSKRGLQVLDEEEYRELVKVNLKGKSFFFVGGFDCSPEGTAMLESMVMNAGAKVVAEVDEGLNYLVVGNRRGPSKIALQNRAQKLNENGSAISFLNETTFLELARTDSPKAKSASSDFPSFVSRLYGHVDEGRLGRALDMLRTDRFQLFTHLDDRRLVGVVRSQSGSGSVYASWLTPDGDFGCSQPDLSDCMGLQGQVCKHLLVLVVGLVRTNQLSQDRAMGWVKSAQGKAPKKNKELCAETFIQYKGAEAGTFDWRPTETVPEDFYAM